MKNYPKRRSTKHEVRSAVIAATLGVGILSWAAFGEEPSPKSGGYETGGRDRVYDLSTGGRGRLYELNTSEAMEKAYRGSMEKASRDREAMEKAYREAMEKSSSKDKSQSSDQEKETPHVAPTSTPHASAPPK